MANASTPGFSRQEAVMVASDPIPAGVGVMVGTGVRLVEIRRHSDGFLDAQLRAHQAQLAHNLSMQETLKQVEMFLGEPSDAGIMAALDRFWVAMNDLAQHPESMAARALVRESAQTVCAVFSRAAHDLRSLRLDIEETARARMAEVNVMARDIANLNEEIIAARSRGHTTNDLEDKRDLWADRIVETTGARVTILGDGSMRVSLQGIAVVDTGNHYPLSVARDTLGNLRLTRVGVEDQLAAGGAVGGLLRADVELAGRTLEALDTLAAAMVAGFNAVHAAGYGLDGSTGRNFFTLTNGAISMAVNGAILGDAGLRVIAAGNTPAMGDGDNARDLAALKRDLAIGGFSGWDEYWREMVGRVGVVGAEVERSSTVGQLLVKELENRRDMVRGVSLDEEVTNLVRFQHAYAAAARLATVADEMLDVIVNRLGLVGR
jgi:flagellar hook-associated protein 1 FlgK